MSAKVPLHQMAAVLAKRSLARAHQAKLARQIAAYLLDSGRTGELNSLARDMVRIRADQGLVEVTAVSAHQLTDNDRTDIEKIVRQLFPEMQRVILNERQEPQLIGGVRLEFPDRQLDLSIRNTLNRFKALTSRDERTALT